MSSYGRYFFLTVPFKVTVTLPWLGDWAISWITPVTGDDEFGVNVITMVSVFPGRRSLPGSPPVKGEFDCATRVADSIKRPLPEFFTTSFPVPG